MVLGFILLGFSVITSGIIYYFSSLYQSWWFFWVPILLIPVLYVLYFGLYLVFCFFYAKTANLKKEQVRPKQFALWNVNNGNYQVVALSNTKVISTGLDKFPNKKCVIVANHTSNFDPMVIMHELYKEKIICITKPENENIPICGGCIHKAGFIPIDRNDARKAVKAINKAASYIKEDVASICIFPEGTRSKDLELHDFHAGSLKVGYLSEASIVVVSLQNTHKIHSNFPFKRTKVYMDLVDVIDYDKYKDLTSVELSNQIYNEIKTHLDNNKRRLQK